MTRKLLVLALVAIATSACGGAANHPSDASATQGDEQDPHLAAEDLKPNAWIVRMDLTTEVDEERYRPLTPPTNEFSTDQKNIYLVGKLKSLSGDALIQIKWFYDADSMPILVSEVAGSEKYDFIASLSPKGDAFLSGAYTVRLFVDGKEVVARPFVVKRAANTAPAKVSDIAFSLNVGAGEKPINPTRAFKPGTEDIYVSFTVKSSEPGGKMHVRWLRGTTMLSEEAFDFKGDRRYSAELRALTGLPEGSYLVELDVPGLDTVREEFVIGKASSGPTVDLVQLGLSVGRDNLPKQPREVFGRETKTIHCGVRFLDLPPSAVVEVRWIANEAKGETVLYTARSAVAAGGSGTMSAKWQPAYTLARGLYRAAVYLDGKLLGEAPFKVE